MYLAQDMKTLYDPSMFKRLFTLWIIFSTLGYSAVWALDIHSNEAESHHPSLMQGQQSTDLQSSQPGDHPDCDHCGHSTAHLLALKICTSDNIISVAQGNDTPYLSSPLFAPTSPLERPPKN